ncbi:hypothetical protein H7J75_22565 [Mycolicibacterium canariasense]|nr:hypothetical protein [Mycolicibacterium canariasense]ORV08520.1 hypothetical protein AWB94_12335 [Mycolicibacterium canariasense]
MGVVPFPGDDDVPDTADGRGSRRSLLVGGIVLALVVALACAAGVTLLFRSNDEGSTEVSRGGFTTPSAASPATPAVCSEPPILEVESFDMTSAGLAIGTAFFPGCAGVEVEAGNAVRVTVADGQRDIAAGEFDFSAAPVAMQGGAPGHQTLVFPAGMYWRTPDMVEGAPTLVAHRGQGRTAAAAAQPGATSVVAFAPAAPEHGSVDGVAEAVLNELRDADYPYVRSVIANSWVPQISSKRAGLVIKGRTLTDADVLADHLALRQRYSGARLVYSGQWSTFNAPDWWVTVVGPSWYFAADANRWCDSEGFDVDDCFAKFVSSMFGAEEGTTVYRK